MTQREDKEGVVEKSKAEDVPAAGGQGEEDKQAVPPQVKTTTI